MPCHVIVISEKVISIKPSPAVQVMLMTNIQVVCSLVIVCVSIFGYILFRRIDLDRQEECVIDAEVTQLVRGSIHVYIRARSMVPEILVRFPEQEVLSMHQGGGVPAVVRVGLMIGAITGHVYKKRIISA